MPQSAAEQDALGILRNEGVHRRIASLRILKGWTQAGLAAQLRNEGLTTGRRTVAGWEADPASAQHHHPEARARQALAKVFGLPEAELFDQSNLNGDQSPT